MTGDSFLDSKISFKEKAIEKLDNSLRAMLEADYQRDKDQFKAFKFEDLMKT